MSDQARPADATPAAPANSNRKGCLGLLAIGTVMYAILETINYFIADALADNQAQVAGGLHGAIEFDQTSIAAMHSQAVMSYMVVGTAIEVILLMVSVLLWAFFSNRARQASATASPATGDGSAATE